MKRERHMFRRIQDQFVGKQEKAEPFMNKEDLTPIMTVIQRDRSAIENGTT